MPLTQDIRRTVTDATPLHVAVGAGDLAVERVRAASAAASRARSDLQATNLQQAAQAVPARAVGKALEAAGRAEQVYDGLAERGKDLIDRVRSQKATRDLVTQGRTTLSRTKAAVTTVRRGAGETAAEAGEAVAQTRATTTKAARSTTTTARKRAASSRSAGKAATTSARKTTKRATKAASAAASTTGR